MTLDVTQRYLDLDTEEQQRQQALQSAGLQDIAPVLLPEPGTAGEALWDGTSPRHFGWPVAAMIGQTLVVAFPVWGKGIHVVRSVDGGQTWQTPIALSSVRRYPDARAPGMCALGSTAAGAFVLSCAAGVFVSEDLGRSWAHRPCRLGPAEHAGNAGPRIVDHPRWGLVLPYHRSRGPGLNYGLCFFRSEDGGETWTETGPVSGPEFAPAEPTIFSVGDALAVFSRNHTGFPDSGAGYHRRWCYFAQFTAGNTASAARFEDLEFTGRRTDIHVRRMDTPDALFNPVSGRIEAVTPKRNEGFPYPDNSYRSLLLWSIDPEAFLRGDADWRFDGVLLRSRGVFSGTPGSLRPPREGFHPGGAVIDLERGVQHLFVYSGNCSHIYGHGIQPRPENPPESATGVFRITRSLHTDRWRAAAGEGDRLAGAFHLHETFADLHHWTPGGSPVALRLTGNKDVIERTVAPFPGPLPKAGPEGLHWETGAAGYQGLHNEHVAATRGYRLSVRTRMIRTPADADLLGLCVSLGARKHVLVLRNDGLYAQAEPGAPPCRIREIALDRSWHTWTLEDEGEEALVRRDGEPMARIPPLIEALPGSMDAPLGLFVRPVDPSSPVALQISDLRLDSPSGYAGP